jgi:outer membrane protein TolC
MKQTMSLLGAALVLSGCASTALDQHRSALDSTAKTIGVSAPQLRAPATQAFVNDALAKPLSQDAAASLALANSAEFHAMLAALETQTIVSARTALPANPVFTFERLVRREDGGVDLDIGRMLGIALVDWLTVPWRREIASAQNAATQHAAASALVQKVAQSRQAWVNAVAAQEKATYFAQVRSAADASAELARRMRAVGNFSKLQHAREHAFYADATAQQTRALNAAANAREALVRTLGLNDAQAQMLKLPDRLPDLPGAITPAPQLTRAALDQRIDIQIANAQLRTASTFAGLSAPLSIVSGLHLEGVRNSETGKPPQKGYEFDLAVPIFDLGSAARLESRSRLNEARLKANAVAQSASSHLRDAHGNAVAAHALAKHYRDEIVPLRKTIAEEMLLKYNGMLTGVFDLLADAREQIGSVIACVDAMKEFWLADAALQAAVLGVPMAGGAMMDASVMSAGDKGGH